jgi:catechol 2,3-dioxygenase
MTLLPDDLRLGPVGLAVGDLDRSLRFYTGRLGLVVRGHGAGRAELGTTERTLLELVERRGAARDRDAAGLFHVALLLPGRADLGRFVLHLAASGAQITGTADHVVSEAIYLDDPDGHGLEVYADRPRDAWYKDGQFQMGTLPLNVEGLLALGRGAGAPWRTAPAGTVVGHVHLESQDVPASRTFYTEALGFAVMADWRRAVFLAKGGYHHHLAVNDWGRRRRRLADGPDRIGLLYYTVEAGDPVRLDRLAATLPDATRTGAAVVARDPAGIPVRFTA